MVDEVPALSPSDALANLAGNLHTLGNPDWLGEAELQAWESHQLETFAERGDEWRMPPSELFASDALVRVTWPAAAPTNLEEWRTQATALQALDRWHAPLSGAATLGSVEKWSSYHEALADRFAIKQSLAELAVGLLVPSSATASRVELSPAHTNFAEALLTDSPLAYSAYILSQLLENTTFIPSAIRHPTRQGVRSHNMAYASLTGSLMTRRVDTSMCAMAVVPVLERPADASLNISDAGDRYEIIPMIDESRLRSIISDTVRSGVDIALMPEIAIPEASSWIISDQLMLSFKDISRETGSPPNLRFLIAGISSHVDGVERAKNQVSIFDSTGQVVFTQNKLFRWDLTRAQIERYGLHRTHGVVADSLIENIDESDVFTVIDLFGIGRILILICADADQASPGDWGYVFAGPDIVYLPVMDMTNPKIESGSDVKNGRWMIKKATRAAYVSRGLAISTNSLYLTHMLNAENAITGVYPPITLAEIALFVDGRPESPRVHQVMSELNSSNLVKRVDVSDMWEQVPT